MRLNGKVAIVTGSGSGIGRATVERLAQEGARVVVNDVDVERINNVVMEIEKEGGIATGIRADVSNRSDIRDLMKATKEKFGRIDILVNNAGVTRHTPFFEMTDKDWDVVIAVDLKGVFNCVQAVAPYMMEQNYGKIVNIASVSGTGCSAHHGFNANYAAAKAGVVQLTKTFARELGIHKINVNCIAPGFVLTPITSTKRNPQEVQEHIEFRKKLAVLNRVGKPEDIANAVLFLVSDESAFISGQLLCVDGGRTDRM